MINLLNHLFSRFLTIQNAAKALLIKNIYNFFDSLANLLFFSFVLKLLVGFVEGVQYYFALVILQILDSEKTSTSKHGSTLQHKFFLSLFFIFSFLITKSANFAP